VGIDEVRQMRRKLAVAVAVAVVGGLHDLGRRSGVIDPTGSKPIP
jgi:hypothetical protein